MVVNDLVFTVGVVGNDPDSSQLVPGGFPAELDQALSNLEAILRAAGSGLQRIVKVSAFVAYIADESSLGTTVRAAIQAPVALTVVAVSGMPLGASVEIECVALVDSNDTAGVGGR